MPQPSEFEEKEFETQLNSELRTAPGRLWAPGQVLEQHVGADVAFFAQKNFFEHIGRPWLIGTWLCDELIWAYLSGKRQGNDAGDSPPDFRANCFIQVKRCHRYKQAHPPLSKPCWKMEINKQQQLRLESIARQLGARIDVGYAAPVFDRRLELFEYAREETLLANSTFPPALELVGHSRWKYDGPGSTGVPNPDDEAITLTPLRERLDNIWQESPSDETPAEQLSKLYSGISDALGDCEEYRLQSDIEHLTTAAGRTLQQLEYGLLRDAMQDEDTREVLLGWTKAAVAFSLIGGVWLGVGDSIERVETLSD